MNSEAKMLAQWFKVLSVGTRVEILQLLKGRVLCVNALAERLNVTQGAVSQHLRVLRQAGLVSDEKRGYYVHYRLNAKTLAAWKEAFEMVLDTESEHFSVKKGDQKCAAATKTLKSARSQRT
jgi:DNA-binding transcriptional ArsR family regulator